MRVIGSGFGRTGTLSLQAALQQLGFGPCYHMVEVVKQRDHARAWLAIARGACSTSTPRACARRRRRIGS